MTNYKQDYHSFDRKSLERLYMSFIRPVLEYSSVVRDTRTNDDKKNLDKFQ